MADVERRLRALETAPRANNTTVHDGYTEWTPRQGPAKIRVGGDTDDENVTLTVVDTLGRDAIEIGTRSDGTAYIRANNADGSAPAFEVTNGVGVFPLAASAWQLLYDTVDSVGRPTTSGSAFQPLWGVVLSLTTPTMHVNFAPFLTGGATQGQLQLSAVRIDPVTGLPTGSPRDVDPPFTFSAPFGANWIANLTIPSTILVDPAGDVVGSLVYLAAMGRVSAGSGVLAVEPGSAVYCI